MFVQHFHAAPAAVAQPLPIVMVHGGLHTGSCFVSTPDNRPGWAPIFSNAGWDVYVVDWPGIGRSGFTWPQSLDISVGDVCNSILKLLQRIGPAVLLGHSIGGALAFKVTEAAPDKVASVIALAPACMEIPNPHVPTAAIGTQAFITRSDAQSRFANAPKFPSDAFDSYFNALVPSPARIRNSAVGANTDLRLDRSRLSIWKQMPTLLLVAEDDRTVTTEQSQMTADLMGIKQIFLGLDWGFEGHGHMFPIELDNELIAMQVLNWLASESAVLGRN